MKIKKLQAIPSMVLQTHFDSITCYIGTGF